MRKKIDPVVDECIETLNMKDGPSRRRLLEGAGLFSATAAASALIAACSSSSSSSAAPTPPDWTIRPVRPRGGWRTAGVAASPMPGTAMP